ncbi:unnamed protein product, partial [Hymenolepis diminuta]
ISEAYSRGRFNFGLLLSISTTIGDFPLGLGRPAVQKFSSSVQISEENLHYIFSTALFLGSVFDSMTIAGAIAGCCFLFFLFYLLLYSLAEVLLWILVPPHTFLRTGY